jgi:hypothetical protein
MSNEIHMHMYTCKPMAFLKNTCYASEHFDDFLQMSWHGDHVTSCPYPPCSINLNGQTLVNVHV